MDAIFMAVFSPLSCRLGYIGLWQALHGWCRPRSSKPMGRVERLCSVGSTPIVCRHYLTIELARAFALSLDFAPCSTVCREPPFVGVALLHLPQSNLNIRRS